MLVSIEIRDAPGGAIDTPAGTSPPGAAVVIIRVDTADVSPANSRPEGFQIAALNAGPAPALSELSKENTTPQGEGGRTSSHGGGNVFDAGRAPTSADSHAPESAQESPAITYPTADALSAGSALSSQGNAADDGS